MQWCPLLTDVGTTLWQVMAWFDSYDNISAIFIFGTKITANIADKSSYIMIKLKRIKCLHLSNRRAVYRKYRNMWAHNGRGVTICRQA